MKVHKRHITSSTLVISVAAFGLLTFFVNPKTAGITGVTVWLALLGIIIFLTTTLATAKFLPRLENRLLMSFLVALTVVVASALSSVQQLSLSDLVLITLIDVVVYYAAVRL